jgi:hypothetical protein
MKNLIAVRKMDYLTFVLTYRSQLRGLDQAGKKFIYDVYSETTDKFINIQEIKDFHFEMIARLECSLN